MSAPTRLCRVCGGPLPKRKKYLCSPECKLADGARIAREKRALTPVPDRPCKECGATVSYVGVGIPPKFCSQACKLRFHSRVRRRRLLGVAPLDEQLCRECGLTFIRRKANQVYCSRRCYQRGNPKRPKFTPSTRRCQNCGGDFVSKRYDQRFCSVKCQRAADGRRRARALLRPLGEHYSDLDVFERDHWRCHLCGKFVRRDVSRNDPLGATIDHIIPLSQGGTDEPTNVATAHRSCNGLKGDRLAGEQLRIL